MRAQVASCSDLDDVVDWLRDSHFQAFSISRFADRCSAIIICVPQGSTVPIHPPRASQMKLLMLTFAQLRIAITTIEHPDHEAVLAHLASCEIIADPSLELAHMQLLARRVHRWASTVEVGVGC